MSATLPARPPSGNKPKIDAKFIADPNLWDPATPREKTTVTATTMTTSSQAKLKGRPLSAPVKRYGFVDFFLKCMSDVHFVFSNINNIQLFQ